MKKTIVLILAIYVFLAIMFNKSGDHKTHELLSKKMNDLLMMCDENMKIDTLTREVKIVSIMIMSESEDKSYWMNNATYEITTLDSVPNHDMVYHYWNTKTEDMKISDDVYIHKNVLLNDELINCIVGKTNLKDISVYFVSYSNSDFIQVDENEIKKLFE